MSLKAITEAVEIVVKDGALFEKLGKEIEHADWIDVGTDALHLGIDLAARLLPAAELNKPLDVPSGATLASDLVARITESLNESVKANGGKLTLHDVIAALRDLLAHPHLLKIDPGPTP